jgi:hypothetical protein
LDLGFDNAEKEVNNGDRVEFFIFVKVDKSERSDFRLTGTNSLHFNLNKIDIFLSNKVINGLVRNFALIFSVQFFHKTEHLMRAPLDHVLVVHCRDGVGEVLHFLVVEEFLGRDSVHQLDRFEHFLV